MDDEFFPKETLNDTENYRCPSCGASMVFDPNKNCLTCDFCEETVKIDAQGMIEARDLVFSDDTLVWDDSIRTFYCVNCGARIELEKTSISTTCCYCGSPNIVEEKDIQGIKPHAVIPFAFDKVAADGKYHKWVKGKIFCPSSFKKTVKVGELSGVYTPSWSFDANTFSSYEGVVGDRYTVRVKTKDGYRTEVRIRYRRVRGTYSDAFKNVMIECSPNITQEQFSKILPYQTETAKSYDKRYLAGHPADHYDKGLQPSWVEARGVIDANIRKSIISACRCDVVQYLNISTSYADKKYKYVLVPVFVGGSKFKEKLYNFFMNGVSGKTTGKTPVSPIRVAIAVALGLAVAAGAAVLAWYAGLF